MEMLPVTYNRQAANCPVNSLPNEILEMILGHVSPTTRSFTEEGRKNTTNRYQEYGGYLRVCKRWCRIYEPFFYRFPDLGKTGWNNPQRMSRLLATLRDRQDLQKCVERLEITPRASVLDESSERLILGIIQACKPNLRSALLHTDWDAFSAWSLIYALEGHRLHSLELLGTSSGIGIQPFLYRLDSPTLRTLKLNRCGCLDTEFDKTPGLELFHPSESSANDLVNDLTHRSGQGSVKTLHLDERYPNPDVTRAFIGWPARLVDLDLKGSITARDPYSLVYTGVQMQNMLEPHRESLENISLGNLVYSDTDNLPDFSAFHRLRKLSMPVQFICDEDPVVAAERLRGPVLTQLDIVLYLIRPPSGRLTRGFVSRHRDWLIRFGATLNSSSSVPSEGRVESAGERQPSHRLETINFRFFPDSVEEIKENFLYPSSGGPEAEASRPWPWMYIEEAAKSIDPMGISVLFEPCMSELEWRDDVEWRVSSSS